MEVAATLKNRHGIHGDYAEQSLISVNILRAMRRGRNWHNLSAAQEEALLLIAVKIGRILTGDNNTADHWHDVAGYAQLVENILNGKPANGVISPRDNTWDESKEKEAIKRIYTQAGSEDVNPTLPPWKITSGETLGDKVRGEGWSR